MIFFYFICIFSTHKVTARAESIGEKPFPIIYGTRSKIEEYEQKYKDWENANIIIGPEVNKDQSNGFLSLSIGEAGHSIINNEIQRVCREIPAWTKQAPFHENLSNKNVQKGENNKPPIGTPAKTTPFPKILFSFIHP